MINCENQNQGSTAPMNTEYDTVMTGLREFKDRNLPELMRGEIGEMVKTTTPATPMATGPRMSGIVKWFNPTKGFGFITPSNGGLDVFVHQSEIQLPGFRSLAQGEPVEYNLWDGSKGPKALKVTGPQGKQVKGAPRQTKKPEKTLISMSEKSLSPVLQPNLLKFAGTPSTIVLANQIPVSTPVLAPTQTLNALPSMISTPTPNSPQISYFTVTNQGFQNIYTAAPAADFPSFTTEVPSVTTMPMSPAPMMIESMPMSPQPHYIPMTPITPVNTYQTNTAPFTFPNQMQAKQMFVSSPPTPVTPVTANTMDYTYACTSSYAQPDNPYDQTPSSFYRDDSHMLTSPMSPIHC